MNNVSNVSPTQPHDDILRGVLARAAQVGSVLLVQGVVLFLGAGRLDWIWAWLFLAIYLASVLVNSFFLMRAGAEMVAERGRAKGAKDWDKLVSGWWSVFQFLLIPRWPAWTRASAGRSHTQLSGRSPERWYLRRDWDCSAGR